MAPIAIWVELTGKPNVVARFPGHPYFSVPHATPPFGRNAIFDQAKLKAYEQCGEPEMPVRGGTEDVGAVGGREPE